MHARTHTCMHACTHARTHARAPAFSYTVICTQRMAHWMDDGSAHKGWRGWMMARRSEQVDEETKRSEYLNTVATFGTDQVEATLERCDWPSQILTKFTSSLPQCNGLIRPLTDRLGLTVQSSASRIRIGHIVMAYIVMARRRRVLPHNAAAPNHRQNYPLHSTPWPMAHRSNR